MMTCFTNTSKSRSPVQFANISINTECYNNEGNHKIVNGSALMIGA